MANLPRFQYQQLDSAVREIRLLRVQQAKHRTDDIKCSIFHTRVVPEGEYVALSYTWGDPAIHHPIELNDCCIAVTAGLEDAIRHFRSATEDLILWADAVCINQDDWDERSSQVRLMRDIYAGAKYVMAWIGNSEVDTGQAYKLVEELGIRILDDFNNGHPMESTEDTKAWVKSQVSARFESCSWMALADLYRRPWWSRAWIVQEIALAKEAIVRSGDFSLPWKYFFGASMGIMLYGITIHQHAREGYNIDSTEYQLVCEKFDRLNDGAIPCRTISHAAEERYRKDSPLSFYKILHRHQSSNSTDPLDKIYAFIGLASEQHREIKSLPIDYKMEVRDLFQAYLRLHLETYRDLEFLVDCCGPNRPNNFSSWMPHYKEARRAIPVSGLELPPHIIYRASAERKPEFAFAEANTVLSLRGIYIDSIKAIGEVATSRNASSVILEWEKVAGIHQANNLLREPEAAKASMSNDEVANVFMSAGLYPTSQFNFAAFGSTLLCDASDSHYDSAPMRLVPHIQPAGIVPISDSGLPSDNLGAEVIMDSQVKGRIALTVPKRRFFVTSKGYYGLGVPDIQAEDGVLILLGSKMPLVARRNGKHHLLVGEAYVHGIMNGEAVVHMECGKLKAADFELC